MAAMTPKFPKNRIHSHALITPGVKISTQKNPTEMYNIRTEKWLLQSGHRLSQGARVSFCFIPLVFKKIKTYSELWSCLRPSVPPCSAGLIWALWKNKWPGDTSTNVCHPPAARPIRTNISVFVFALSFPTNDTRLGRRKKKNRSVRCRPT